MTRRACKCVHADAELCRELRHGGEAAFLERQVGMPLMCPCVCHEATEQPDEPGARG